MDIPHWIIGLCKRKVPKLRKSYSEASALIPDRHQPFAFQFEEGFLAKSDADFVVQRICNGEEMGGLALNHCRFLRAERFGNGWRVYLHDELEGQQLSITVRHIINCAGVWVDKVNEQMESRPHSSAVFSKGVSLVLKGKPWHKNPLVVDMGNNGDTLCLLPFEDQSIWGPTETTISKLDQGFSADQNDIAWLIAKYNEHFKEAIRIDDVVATRTGSAPLLFPATTQMMFFEISRDGKIYHQVDIPWTSIYGGKIIGSREMGQQLAKELLAVKRRGALVSKSNRITYQQVLGIKVICPIYAKKHLFCHDLESFLRRRTNLAMTIPNGGFGCSFEHTEELEKLSLIFCDQNKDQAKAMIQSYKESILNHNASIKSNLKRKEFKNEIEFNSSPIGRNTRSSCCSQPFESV